MSSTNGTVLLDPRIFVFKPNFRRKFSKFTTPATTLGTAKSTTLGPKVIVLGLDVSSNSTTAMAASPLTTSSILDPKVIVPGAGGQPKPGELALCAPFPACDPIGCEDPTVAPIDCPDCNRAETNATIFGMLLLSLLIVAANILVIRIILQTPTLRRRHGYIKLSMAASDLLVGLFVIPSAIANLVISLYYPFQTKEDVEKFGEMSFEAKAQRLLKINSTTSVVFGTISVVAVVSSLYNLLLLSADRLLAIARPLKHRAGRFYTNRSLWISIAAVWIFGIALSIIPGFFPSHFWYQVDATTFFFIQKVEGNRTGEEVSHNFSPYYVTIIIGGPYFVTVALNILTAIYTWKSIKTRKRLSSRGNMTKSAARRKCERNRRMQMLQEAYPEMVDETTPSSSSTFKGIFKGTPRHQSPKRKRPKYSNGDAADEKEKQTWLSWWRGDDNIGRFNCSNSNNNSTDSECSQQPTQSPRFQRTRDQIQIVRDILNPTNARNKAKQLKASYKTHIRVFKMLIAMVVAFSVCLLPYVIVSLQMSNGSLVCDNLSGPFTFAMYMLFMNSGMNFVIYNLWHPEFRQNLAKTFRKDYSKTTGFRRAASTFFGSSQKGTESSMTYATRASTESNHNAV